MNENEFKTKLSANGWKEENLDNLPNFSLYKGVKCIMSFDNRVSAQFHPEQGYIRILISGKHETLATDEKGFIKQAMMDDTIGIQLSYGKKLDKTIDKIIENKDNLIIKNWIMLPSFFESVSDASILCVEQFLDKNEYMKTMGNKTGGQSRSVSRGQNDDEAVSLSNEISGFMKNKEYGKVLDMILAHMKNNKLMNTYLYSCISFICACSDPNFPKPSKEDLSFIVDSVLKFLNSLSALIREENNLYFIQIVTTLMIETSRYDDCVKAIQKYRSLGGTFSSNIYLNYSSSACDINDVAMQKAVLEECIYAFENQKELFSKKDTSFLYNADNIAALSAVVGDKSTMLKYLNIAKENDPDFVKNNKTNEDYKKYWNDPDFIALFDESKKSQTADLSGDDPVVFPGKIIAKLSDYVAVIKGIQKGDMLGTLKKNGIELTSWGTIATEWMTKLASDGKLNEKFTMMLMK